MANKNKKKFNKIRNDGERVVDVNYTKVPNKPTDYSPAPEEPKPAFDSGNYVITVVAQGEILKKLAIARAEIYVQKLADGGLTVDLK